MAATHSSKTKRSFSGDRASDIEMLAISSLHHNPKNARTHSLKQIKKIAASIDRFGFNTPILVDTGNMIWAGHGRVLAATQLGLKHIPAMRIDHLTDAQKRAYMLADNHIAEQAGWDREMLDIELGELADLLLIENLDVSITGFDVAEIDLLRADMGATATEPDDLPLSLPPKPVTRRGDLWALNSHRILCGDARDRKDIARLMNGAQASAGFCDPPYNLKVCKIGGRGRTKHREFAFASGEMTPKQFEAFLSETLGHAIDVSVPGAVHYVCMDWRHITNLVAVGSELYDTMLNLVVWNKTNAGQGSLYRSQHELIGVFRVSGAAHRNNVELGRFGRNRSNVWTYAGVNTFGRSRMEALASHPTVKPVSMVADALLDCTARGEVVLDQFLGVGSTILAAEKVARKGYGLEYEPGYVDVAIQRWQRVTNLEATLVGDGRTFDQVSASRSGATDAKQSRRNSP